MDKRPSYAELVKRVQALEKEVVERMQEEETLRESAEGYRDFFNLNPEPVVIVQDKVVKLANSAYTKLFGVSQDDIDKGISLFDHLQEKDKDAVDQRYKKRLSGEELQGVLQVEIRSNNGKKIPCEAYSSLIQHDGRPALLAVIRDISHRKQIEEELAKHRDHLKDLITERTNDLQKVNEELLEEISERKHAEVALRESEAKYKSIFENVAVSILLIDMDGKMLDINPYHINHIARGKVLKENLLGQNLFEYPTVVSGGISEELKKVLEGKPVNISDHYFPMTSGGNPTYFNSRAVPLFVDGKVTGAVLILEDITKIKQSEMQIRELSQQLLKIQESERQMISYELHDSVAQDLSSSRIACEMLLRYKSLTPGARKQVLELSENLHKTLGYVRDLSYELQPSGLKESGLSHTMYQFCKDFSEQTGVRVDFKSAGIDNLNLDYDTMINLYRLLQEGLNNVKKHADAGSVQVRLVSSFPNVILRIDDNGKGFDLRKHLAGTDSEKRMGLRSMKYRVDLLQGKINIDSIPGKGTKVFIEVSHKGENIEA